VKIGLHEVAQIFEVSVGEDTVAASASSTVLNFGKSMPTTIAPCSASRAASASARPFQPSSPDSNNTKLAD